MSEKYLSLVILASLFLLSCDSVRYIGTSYPPTDHIDIYYSVQDVKKEYEVIGKASNAGNNLQKNQNKIINEAKKRGANGIIYSDVQSATSVTAGYSTSSDVLNAEFIKYK